MTQPLRMGATLTEEPSSVPSTRVRYPTITLTPDKDLKPSSEFRDVHLCAHTRSHTHTHALIIRNNRNEPKTLTLGPAKCLSG